MCVYYALSFPIYLAFFALGWLLATKNPTIIIPISQLNIVAIITTKRSLNLKVSKHYGEEE